MNYLKIAKTVKANLSWSKYATAVSVGILGTAYYKLTLQVQEPKSTFLTVDLNLTYNLNKITL